MAPPSTLRNSHPVDRLASLRAEVKELEAEIESIRASILADHDLKGDLYEAKVVSQQRQVLSRPKLERMFGKVAVDKCCDNRTVLIVKTVPRTR